MVGFRSVESWTLAVSVTRVVLLLTLIPVLLEWSRRCHRLLVNIPGLDSLPSGFELLQILQYHASELLLVKTTVTDPRAGYNIAALLLAISLSLRKHS